MKKISLLLTLISLNFSAAFAQEINMSNQSPDCVVMLHGLLRQSDSLKKIATKLHDEAGFRILNLDYPASKFRIEELVEIIHPQISEFSQHCEGRVNFVGHSIGGLVTRAYIHKYRPQNLGKVVMLGTPNHGSKQADVAMKLPFVKTWFKKTYGPARKELITDQSGFKHLFGEVNYELHIISGNLSRSFLAWIIFHEANDGKVSVRSTKLDGMRSHNTFEVNHDTILTDDFVIGEIVQILQE